MSRYIAHVQTDKILSRVEVPFEVPDDELEDLPDENDQRLIISSHALDAVATVLEWGWRPDEGAATLTGRVDIAGRLTAAELESLPRTDYVKAVAEYGNPDDGFGVAILPGNEPPLSTMSVANEVRALIDALPEHEFEGVLDRKANEARFGGATSRIGVLGRTVRY